MAPLRSGQAPVESPRYVVVAALISAALVAVVLWGTFVASTPPSLPPCTALECGSTAAIGSPAAEGGPGNYSYRMTITPSSGLTWGQSHFAITSPTGQNLSPLPSWTILILPAGSSGSPVAVYPFDTGSWTLGAHTLAASGQTIDLELGPSDLRGQGDEIVMFIAWGGYPSASGTVSESLP
jgi:hypothetical protein